MPFTMPFPDPTADVTLSHCYIWAVEMNLNFATQFGRIVYFVHRDEVAADTGKNPLGVIAFDLTPTGTPAVLNSVGDIIEPAFPSFPELMAANQTAFSDVASAVYQLIWSRPEYSGAALIVKPTVTATTPTSGGTAAGVTAVTITFNLDIDPTTLNFTLTDSGNNPVATTMTYVDMVATFTVATALTPGVYTGNLAAVNTPNNDILATPVTWTFTAT